MHNNNNVVYQIEKTIKFGEKLYIEVVETEEGYDLNVRTLKKSQLVSQYFKERYGEFPNNSYIDAVDEANEIAGHEPIQDLESFLEHFYFGK